MLYQSTHQSFQQANGQQGDRLVVGIEMVLIFCQEFTSRITEKDLRNWSSSKLGFNFGRFEPESPMRNLFSQIHPLFPTAPGHQLNNLGGRPSITF